MGALRGGLFKNTKEAAYRGGFFWGCGYNAKQENTLKVVFKRDFQFVL